MAVPMKEHIQRQTNIEAVVFDAYGTLFDLDTIALEYNKIYPGNGDRILELVRQKQLEYAWIRSLVDRYKDFAYITQDSIKFTLKKMRFSHS
ncbi:MAG: hypothetical protein ACREBS_07555 [Nitrososphaerales archaeon]